MYIVLFFIVSFALEVFLQHWWISVMRKMKVEQVTKKYGPSWHEATKLGVPDMGGVVFIPVLLLSAFAAGVIVSDFNFNMAARIVSYPILAALVGFVDDWLKYRGHSSDGLKSLQKLALQIAVTTPWAIWVGKYSQNIYIGVSLPAPVYVALVTFVCVGLLNAVNVTDGLDGLAAGASLLSFAVAFVFISWNAPVTLLNAAACGICAGFLWHNANPASVFMGDVGSHFLAGLLASFCVNGGMLLLLIPLGFIFGVEILSVATQIAAIRLFKRKVFKMSPIHHHFELSGWKETQIVTRFWLIHIMGMLVLNMLFFLAFFILGFRLL